MPRSRAPSVSRGTGNTSRAARAGVRIVEFRVTPWTA